MFVPTYLLKSRHGLFYFRWPLPKQLHPQRKAETIKLSLQTRDPHKALRLSRSLIQIGEQLNDHGIAYGMRYDELHGLLKKHFRELLDKVRNEIDIQGRLNEKTRQDYELRLATTEREIAEGRPLSFDSGYQTLLAGFMAQYRVPFSNADEQYGWLERDFKKAVRSFLKAALDHDASYDQFDLSAPVDSTISVAEPQPRPSPAPLEQPSGAGITIEELAKRFIMERTRGGNWVATTVSGKEEYLGLLTELFGANRDIATLTQQDVTTVKDTLFALPKHRHKKQETIGKPLAEVLIMTNLPRLSVPSINKYLQTYNDFFGYAHQHGHIKQNLFAAVAIKQNRQRLQAKTREGFTPEQVRTILDAIVDGGLVHARKPHQKWGPLIGLYTGARLNEIAQIDLTDIKQEDGIWYFDLNDEGDEKKLKTLSAKRRVPVHKDLIALGFSDYVETLRQRGVSKLFHDLSTSVEHGRGRAIGRWFNETLLPSLGIKTKLLVFHSLRHTVVTKLVNAQVDGPLIKALVGHSQQGVTYQSYFGGHTLHLLNEAVQKLDYSLPAQKLDTAIQD
ncbi:site-specific integrase [Rhizobium laguerreae]|uniref:tyrosine-type recombinase/integrase n=1 Tax=Rhizobium laguerreae TaxID=1076926 RepID=UPI001C91ED3E|nr:tyrosine-type recombinase/integrase [Rhizobium laguerreae]MBY3144870.1 site-specific integrase [Rhizobium laguerreae]